MPLLYCWHAYAWKVTAPHKNLWYPQSLWLSAKSNPVVENTLYRLTLKSKLIAYFISQIDFLLEGHSPWWQPSQSLWPKWENVPSWALQISLHWAIRHASSFWKLSVRLILVHSFQGSGLTTCCYEQSTDGSKWKKGGELKNTKHEEQ